MANKIYQNTEPTKTWRASGGNNTITLTSLAVGSGRNGEIVNLGPSPRSSQYIWRYFTEFQTLPGVGYQVEVYWRPAANSTAAVNNDPITDSAVTNQSKLANLIRLGTLTVDENTADVRMEVVGGPVELPFQYGGPVIWNASNTALSATSTVHGFDLTPVPLEVQ